MIRYYFVIALFALLLTGCQQPPELSEPTAPATPGVSPIEQGELNDNQIISVNGEVVLTVEHPEIIHYFQTSFFCDEGNRSNHQDFCSDVSTLIERIYFDNVVVSPNEAVIGFTMGSTELEPDRAVGTFRRNAEEDPVTFLTPYYLGNQFIGFSPSGMYFVYQTDCFEGYCGLYVGESDTLATRATINSAEYADERTKKVVFNRWISDTEIEYLLGEQLSTFDFSEEEPID